MKLRRRKHGRPDYGFKTRSPFRHWITAPFRYLFNWLGRDEEPLGDHTPWHTRIARAIVQIAWFPIFCVWQVVQFIVLSWTTTRSFSAFLVGATPLLVACALIAAVIGSNFTEDRLARSRHRQYTVDAEASGDFEAALLGSKRVQLISDKPQWRYIHALTLLKAGLTENADLIMQELAPLDRPGNMQAHLYLAQQQLEQFARDPSRFDLLDQTEMHLNNALESDPDNTWAVISRAKVWMYQGKTDEAMNIFQQVSDREPSIVPQLAKYLIDKGDTEMANFHIKRGLDQLRLMAEDDPNNGGVWETMFMILMVNEDYERAMQELMRAFAMVEDPAVRNGLRILQSNVMVEFAKKFDPAASQDSFHRRLIASSRSLLFYPRNGPALDIFVDLVLYPQTEEQKAWLDEESADGITPVIYHLVHGLQDAIEGKPVTAKKHFSLALDGDARMSIIVNDISWIVGIVKNQPEDGLRLINLAIDTWPGAKLFQTRGEILMKQGRYTEALEELEYAAEEIDNDPRSFEVLAECHEALGNTEQAAAARQRSQEKRAELTSKLADRAQR